jgi:hypothetical protein
MDSIGTRHFNFNAGYASMVTHPGKVDIEEQQP